MISVFPLRFAGEVAVMNNLAIDQFDRCADIDPRVAVAYSGLIIPFCASRREATS
jgi:hypothetical protein